LENTVTMQLYSMLVFLISGIIIGVFFDFFRILRKSFKTSDIITYIEDIIFWILTGLFLIFVLFQINNGEIRLYNIIGLFIGIILYMIFVSKIFININVKIINFLKKIFIKLFKILLYPIKLLFNILKKLLKPISFFVINVKKITKNFSKKNILWSKNKKISKKCVGKEGF